MLLLRVHRYCYVPLQSLAVLVLLVRMAAAEQLPADVNCVVCDKPASSDFVAEWKGKKIYLACPNCVATFRINPDAYAREADIQLIATGQVKPRKQAQGPATQGESA